MSYHFSYRKILKRIALIFLISFLILSCVGMFLRTDRGLHLAINVAQYFLEKQGMSLSYSAVSGPLPTHIAFNNLQITDQKGVWFSAHTLSVDVQLSSLVHGMLAVPQVTLDNASILRTPESASLEEKSTPSKGFSLPIDIDLEHIEMHNIHMAESLLFPSESPNSYSTQKDSDAKGKNTLARDTSYVLDTNEEPQSREQENNKDIVVNVSGKAKVSSRAVVLALQSSISFGNDESLDVTLALDEGKKVKSFLDTLKNSNPTILAENNAISSNKLHMSFPSSLQGENIDEPWLALHIRGAISPNGNIAKALQLPNTLGGALLIHGISPLANWKGSLGFSLVDKAKNTPLTGMGYLQLALTESSSFFASDKKIHAKAAILVNGGKGYESLPYIEGKTCYLVASASGTTSELSTDITVETDPLKVSIHDLILTKKGDESSLIGKYTIEIPRLKALSKDQVDTSFVSPALLEAKNLLQKRNSKNSSNQITASNNSLINTLSVHQLAYTLATSETLSSISLMEKNQWDTLFESVNTTEMSKKVQDETLLIDDISLFLSGDISFAHREDMHASSEGKLLAYIKNTEHALSYAFNAYQQKNKLQLDKFIIEGLGLSVHASGSAVLEELKNGKISFDLLASGKEDSPWQTLINSFLSTKQEPSEQQFNGAFSFKAHAVPDKKQGTKGTVSLASNNMQWATEQMQSLLGSSPSFAMNFLGGGHLPWELHLTECSTPFMSGTMDATLVLDEQEKIRQSDKNASLFAHSKIQATAQMSLPDISLLSSALKGSATIKAMADGPLYNFTTNATVTSSSVQIPSGKITDILASLTTQISLPVSPSIPLQISSKLSAQAKDFYSDNLSLHSSWTIKEKKKETSSSQTSTPLEIAMPELLATGAGVHISGKATGIIDSSPHLTGDLTFSVLDWAHFSAITGIPLSGGKTEISVLLSPQTGQKVTATILSKDLHTKDTSFSLASLSGTIDINNLFGTPKPFVNLQAGVGHAGLLDWEKGTIEVTQWREKVAENTSNKRPKKKELQNGFSATKGNVFPISITFYGKPTTTFHTAKKQKSTYPFKGTDRIKIDALLYPELSSLELRSFALYLPKAQTGLYLSQTSTIHFAPSLAIESLRMKFLPEGNIAVDGLFSSMKTSLEATVTNLPIERLGALADVNVPEGNISLSMALHRKNTTADGNLSIQGRLANSATKKTNTTLPFSLNAHLASHPDGSFPHMPLSQNSLHFVGKGKFFSSTEKSTIQKSNVHEENATGNMAFDFPLVFNNSGIPLLATKQPFGFSLQFNGALESLWQIASSPDRELTGTGNLTALYSGTLEKPKGSITALVKNGQFEDHILGIFLTNITLNAKTENNTKQGMKIYTSLFATDGKRQKAQGLLDAKEKEGTIAIEALIGQKSQIINSSIAKNLALRSGNEAQKITDQARTRTDQEKNTQKTSIDWASLSKKESEASPKKNANKEVVQNNILRVQKTSQQKNLARRNKFRPIIHLSDTRIADTDMVIALRGQIHNLEPLQRDDISLQLSGLLGVEGSLTSPHITGDFLVQELEVLLELLSLGKNVTTLPIVEKDSSKHSESESSPTADIHIGIPGKSFIRGFGLDSEWQGDANITGKLSSPLLSGSLHAISGDVELLSKSFEFSKGEIFFLGGIGAINPGIDMDLVNRSSSLEAHVRVTGTAADPHFELASIPSIPRDEIVSQVLFNKQSSSLSRFEALQLADTLNSFFGDHKKSLLSFSSVRKKLGIDVLRVNSGNTDAGRKLATSPNAEEALDAPTQSESDEQGIGTMSIEAGKYILDNVYLGVQQDTDEGTSVKVDVELTPRVSIQGSSSQTSSQIGAGWKRDY